MTEISWAGGTPADRDEIAAQHHAYLEANAEYDWERLQNIWSSAPDATFFNLNGHVYRGREHWTSLWKYYRNQIASGFWEPFEARGVISGDLATVWCLRRTRAAWVGSDPRPDRDYHDGNPFISRSTMVFRREDDGWRVVHAHFSKESREPRPGGV